MTGDAPQVAVLASVVVDRVTCYRRRFDIDLSFDAHDLVEALERE